MTRQPHDQFAKQYLEEGRQEERYQMVENLLKVRFGSLDEELSFVIQALLQLPTEEFARVLLELSNLSREQLLTRFKPSTN